jgi:MFS family permease
MKKGALPKYFTLLSLYLAQAIPMSFFSTIVPVIMRQENYSLESIGLLQLIKLPWIFKFLWAPMVDMRGNSLAHYRRWILTSEFIYAIIIIAVGFLDLQTSFTNIILLMIIAFVASGTQDIATDAYAILTLKYSERSFGNSMQSAGSFLGTLVGSGVLLVMYHKLGWQGVLWGMALFVIIAIIPILIYRPKMDKHLKVKREKKVVRFTDSFTFFAQPKIYKRIILLTTFYSGIIGVLAMQKPFMVDLGYSVKQIGLMAGIYGTAIGTAAALLGGFIIKRVGRKVSLVSIAILGALASGYFFAVSLGEVQLYQLYIGIALVWATYGMSSVGIYTISMDIVRTGREGTDFTVQIVLTHLSSLIIAVLSGKVADTLGYSGLFLAQTVMAISVIAITYFFYNQKELACNH